jgi:hypothetical protein
VLGSGYGIFSGADVQWAVLRFSPERSRWVAQEKWHPDQQGRPSTTAASNCACPTATSELLMDILRHGRHVEVLDPRICARRSAGTQRSAALNAG